MAKGKEPGKSPVQQQDDPTAESKAGTKTRLDRILDTIERIGNRLPDPAVLFVIGIVIVWVASAILAPMQFAEIDPRSGKPIAVQNQLAGKALAEFLSAIVRVFVNFPPLGVVLVALLGVGVAEHTGFINAGLKAMLSITGRRILTPMLILVACLSHTATDAGYVLVIPLGAVIFYAAGRHPLAGIAAAFAGVSGGFSANFIPSGIDPLLQGLTQAGGRLLDPNLQVNPLCNFYFTAASTVLIVLLGWLITDKVIEPRLRNVPVELESGVEPPKFDRLEPLEKKGLTAGVITLVLGGILLVTVLWPADSALRSPDGQLTAFSAPIMQSIVPLIFLFFLIPGIVYGYVAKTVESHRTIVQGMSKSMSTMGYYIVLAFFAALFVEAFGKSNLGALVALKGAAALKELALPPQVTIVGIILLTASVNLLIGSSSAKWALLAPIFVPMLMQLGISPELTQAAYRVGDSTTNIITPLMAYFPLIVVFAQRWVKKSGVGTLISLMLPYSVCFLVTWSTFLLIYWGLGLPLGVSASYTYPP